MNTTANTAAEAEAIRRATGARSARVTHERRLPTGELITDSTATAMSKTEVRRLVTEIRRNASLVANLAANPADLAANPATADLIEEALNVIDGDSALLREALTGQDDAR